MNKKWGAWILSAFVAVQAGAAGLAGFVVLENQVSGTLPESTRVGNMLVAGLTPDEAVLRVLADPEAAGLPGVLRISLPVVPEAQRLSSEGAANTEQYKSYPLNGATLSLRPSEAHLRERLAVLSADSVWTRMLADFSVSSSLEGAFVALPLHFQEQAVRDAAADIASVHGQQAVPATAQLQGETLLVESGQWGRELDATRLFAWFSDTLANGVLPEAGASTNRTGVLAPATDDPEICRFIEPHPTAAMFQDMRRAGSADVLMAEGGAGDASRAETMLSGRLVSSRESISLAAWFEESGFMPQTADAASRVATALFRTLLPIDGITVRQRRPSPFATNFAPPGQEAVLLDEGDDLVLVNDSEQPILLMASAEGESLRVFAFTRFSGAAGTLFSDVTGTTEPPLIQSPTRELSPGEVRVLAPGRAGIQVSVYRVDAQGKALLHADTYPPQNRVLEVGMLPDPRLTK